MSGLPSPANESAESLDEAALVTQLKAGDAAAFERLVRLHSPHLLAVARRFLGSEDDAQDAVQDAFLAAFRAIGKFVGHARLSTWLHRIVVNASLMKLRTRRRRPEHSIEELLPSFLDDGHQVRPTSFWNESRFDDAEIGETRDLVISSIEKLPEAYRTVLMMRDIEEMDTAETARQLDLSEAAVKTRLHRARQALRTLLDPYFREPKP